MVSAAVIYEPPTSGTHTGAIMATISIWKDVLGDQLQWIHCSNVISLHYGYNFSNRGQITAYMPRYSIVLILVCFR